MKITWLGQAGLLFEKNGLKIMVDPYLSDSCKALNPKSARRVPVDENVFDIKPDVIILTHNHLDHTDPETLKHFIKEDSGILVLASENAWANVRTMGGNNNYVRMHPYTEWTFKGIHFSAVKADHSDANSIGMIIDDGDKKYYVTGDTLYNRTILDDIPDDIEAVFLPVNGVGNNMNMIDAKRFSEAVGAKYTVPLHFGLFDDINGNDFECDGKVVPEFFKEIILK